MADALGLELYLGPPREPNLPPKIGFAESGNTVSDFERREALRAGFQPLPYHRNSTRKGVAPLSFARSWLDDHKLDVEHLSVVECQAVPGGGAMSVGSLALVDDSAPRALGPDLWCFRDKGQDTLARLQWIDDSALVIHADSPDAPARVLMGKDRASILPLGKVVWIGAAPIPAP